MPSAVVFSEYGNPDVLGMRDVPELQPGEGELRIAVKAAGVNPFDCRVRSGFFADGGCLDEPLTPGTDFAGLVDLVGPGVHGFFVGEEVFGFVASGSYAEFIVVKAELTVHKPKRLSWEAAAVLPSVGLTAVSALDQLQIKKGETLLLHAAAGGVGTVATQLAVARGARVIGTCGEHNRDYLRSLGAVPVLYGEGLEERVRELGEVDAALDCVGGEAIDVSLKLVKDRQRIGTITSPFLIESTGIRWIDCVKDAKTLEFLAETEIQLPIAKSFPLAEAAAAHRLSEGGHVRGKLVLTIE